MPAYTYPGVYVEEIPPLARPIAGVGTSTAAFIGVADLADTVLGKPEVFTSWSDFETFLTKNRKPAPAAGPPDPPIFTAGNLRLALAVLGFFQNGGTVCYVVPVSDMSKLGAALTSLEPIDEIAIVAAPGADTAALKTLILAHCHKLKDRVAVLDSFEKPDSDANPDLVYGGAANTLPTDATTEPSPFSYGAVYFPWLKVSNPLWKEGATTDPEKFKLIDLPPSGHVAGVWARVDATRGVHKAPANEPILGIVGLQRLITKETQGVLNLKGINVIRAFGGAHKVYGARTIGDKNGEFTYLNVRRFMNFLKESIEEGTQFVVFEPNNPSLWQRIIRSVSDFLYNQWRDGALFGETAKQAFFVHCDAATNPSSTRDAGQVITEIGVAVTKPAEFVIFKIQQTTGS